MWLSSIRRLNRRRPSFFSTGCCRRREGQLKWQEKSDNNSLRRDIAKNMLSDPKSIPKENGKYLNASLPQYQDIDAALKIIKEALGKAAKK